MKKTIEDISGIVLFDKPSGITSHDAVNMLRQKLNIKRIGHTGTLDPMATGLLVFLVAKAAKYQSKIQTCSKVYEGEIEFGIETDTWDIEGKILKKCEVRAFKRQELKQIISFMTGKITQEVPSFSAVRYKGKHLYKLARKNLAIPVIKRQVNVKWLKYSYKKPVMNFKIECSGGTYIRSIAHEIGVMLGCGGRLSGLRRLKVGLWDIKSAVDSDFLSRSSYEQIKSRIMDIPDDLKYR